jgi:hypothetical protein
MHPLGGKNHSAGQLSKVQFSAFSISPFLFLV